MSDEEKLARRKRAMKWGAGAVCVVAVGLLAWWMRRSFTVIRHDDVVVVPRNAVKLTQQDIDAILLKCYLGERQADIAREFGISQSRVSKILNMKLGPSPGVTEFDL